MAPQSTSQGPRSLPPVPLLLLLLLLLLLSSIGGMPGPQEHPTFQTTGSKRKTGRKSLMRRTINPHSPA
jgi:hypothetical protein